MAETRRLAAEYRASTGQTLAVSNELARYDVSKIFSFAEHGLDDGVDFLGNNQFFSDKKIIVKSRVIFDENKSHYRVGKLSTESNWDYVFLVLYSANYEPTSIYFTAKSSLDAADNQLPNYGMAKKNQNDQLSDSETSSGSKASRGAMTIAKFKAIGKLLWTKEGGIEMDNALQDCDL